MNITFTRIKQLIRCAMVFVLLFAGSAHSYAQTALYYRDYSVGADNMYTGLVNSGYAVTLVTTNGAFQTQIASATYDVAVYCAQNSGSDVTSATALYNFVNNNPGKKGVFFDYAGGNGALFGAPYTGNTNMTSVQVTDASIAAGLTSNPFPVTNPGWGVFSRGMSLGTGATSLAYFTSNSQPAIVRSMGGRMLVLGYIGDAATINVFTQTVSFGFLDIRPTFTSTGICAGSTFTINYSATGPHVFNSGNTFTAQLSDAAGSFASPVTIGTTTSTSTSGTISATIPALTVSGANYKIRIVSSNTAFTGSQSAVFSIGVLKYNVTGGGAVCAPGGVSVGLSNSRTGTSYQLYNGVTTVGSSVAGTGAAISFGSQTNSGTYTVKGTNTCGTDTMIGSATVTINPLPTAYAVTGGGSYCAGGTGVVVGLANSQSGINYQLKLGGVNTGTPVAGTGAAISFGTKTAGGTYTVVATNATTTCTITMTGSAVITVNPLPTAYAVTGGGAYCAGGLGLSVGLANSEVGVDYQLYNGVTALGSPEPGTGAALNFGTFTAAGTYTVQATNPTTTCGPVTMTGNAVITVNPNPSSYVVIGGGQYCTGGTGISVGLSNSQAGVNYQLKIGGVNTGTPVAGTGSSISFGAQTATGTYTVTATNATTSCGPINMSGSVAVSTYPLPTAYAVTGGGGYCAGGTGVSIGLANTQTGVEYQLYNGVTPVAAVMNGTGSAISFGSTFTTAGTYTIIATNTTTTCTNGMTGSAVVVVNALPAAFAVTGGGQYCAGGTGVAVGLANSQTGINYQLYNGVSTVGTPVAGTGAAISFGNQTVAGTYTVQATNATTSCGPVTMTGSAAVVVNPNPVAYAVTGGGQYCAGGAGFAVGLANSQTGVNYQLYNGVSTVGTPLAGTGAALSFGNQTAAGTYTIQATNATTSCGPITMTGNAVIVVNPQPVAYAVTGGGQYCAGGTGVAVGLANSQTGVNYQLYNGVSTVGTAVAGTGAAISFGNQTTVGTYTVQATNATTNCGPVTMTGSAAIVVNPNPVVYAVTGGGQYCAGGTGIAVGLTNSETGVNYQLYNGVSTVGTAVAGTGAAISFGNQTAAGTYTVQATNATTNCGPITMTGNAVIVVNPQPVAYAMTGGGAYCAGGTGVAVGLSNSQTGVNYQLLYNGSPLGAPIAGTGAALSLGNKTAGGTYTIQATNTTTNCGPVTMTGSAVVTVNPLPVAQVLTGGGTYCAGATNALVGIAGSETGVNYQLYNGVTAVGTAVAGTGAAINFGNQTTAGIYTVQATNATTGCGPVTMSGSAIIIINPQPLTYTVTGGGAYCAGGTGVAVGLSNSQSGVSYQLYEGASAIGSAVAGTGAAISFGSQTVAGTYTVKATNSTTNCGPVTMTGNAVITINPQPIAYTMTGGGQYCAGGTGMSVGLSNSQTGVNYQLYNGVSTVGTAIAGTGAALNFGLQTVAGTYTVQATNATTNCGPVTMTGSATIVVNPQPTAYNVIGGGSYCAGTGGVQISVASSQAGVNYQLYNGVTAVGTPIAGTGVVLNFPNQTAAGTYTVQATNATTGCGPVTMTGSATVTVNPVIVPSVSIVASANNVCSGGNITFTATPVNPGTTPVYQWYRNNAPVGTNSATYSSSALSNNDIIRCQMVSNALCANPATVQSNNITMNLTPTITPTVNITTNVTSPVCYGVVVYYAAQTTGAGTAPVYQWSVDGVPVGTNTNQYIDFGTMAAGPHAIACTLTSNYACVTTNTATKTFNMTVSPILTPSVTITNNTPANTICNGSSVTFTAAPVNGGSTPAYQWKKNGVNISGATSSTYATTTLANGDIISVQMTSNTQCKAPATVQSNNMTMTVNPILPASVSIVSSVGNSGCETKDITFTATPVNGGTNPAYQWRKNGVDIVGATSSTYTDNTLVTGNIITVRMTSNAVCPNPAIATSNAITMTINPLIFATVAISVSPDSVGCEEKLYQYSSHFTNGGATQRYQWIKNGVNLPKDTTAFYSALDMKDGDQVQCLFMSSAVCAFPVTSNVITMHLSPALEVEAEIIGFKVDGGIQFHSQVKNGGSNPIYQWRKNNADIPGATLSSYLATSLNYTDKVSLMVTSDEKCAKSTTVVSPALTYLQVTSVSDTKLFEGLSLFPNPNEGMFNIQGRLSGNTAVNSGIIEVVNAVGQVIYKERLNINNNKLDVTVNMGSHAAGMYNVRLHVDGRTEILRCVIAH